jgi:hypothetical protein
MGGAFFFFLFFEFFFPLHLSLFVYFEGEQGYRGEDTLARRLGIRLHHDCCIILCPMLENDIGHVQKSQTGQSEGVHARTSVRRGVGGREEEEEVSVTAYRPHCQ